MALAVPGTDKEFAGLSPSELEVVIVELHRTQALIGKLTGRYRDDLRWDDKQRNQIREDHRARRGPP